MRGAALVFRGAACLAEADGTKDQRYATAHAMVCAGAKLSHGNCIGGSLKNQPGGKVKFSFNSGTLNGGEANKHGTQRPCGVAAHTLLHAS